MHYNLIPHAAHRKSVRASVDRPARCRVAGVQVPTPRTRAAVRRGSPEVGVHSTRVERSAIGSAVSGKHAVEPGCAAGSAAKTIRRPLQLVPFGVGAAPPRTVRFRSTHPQGHLEGFVFSVRGDVPPQGAEASRPFGCCTVHGCRPFIQGAVGEAVGFGAGGCAPRGARAAPLGVGDDVSLDGVRERGAVRLVLCSEMASHPTLGANLYRGVEVALIVRGEAAAGNAGARLIPGGVRTPVLRPRPCLLFCALKACGEAPGTGDVGVEEIRGGRVHGIEGEPGEDAPCRELREVDRDPARAIHFGEGGGRSTVVAPAGGEGGEAEIRTGAYGVGKGNVHRGGGAVGEGRRVPLEEGEGFVYACEVCKAGRVPGPPEELRGIQDEDDGSGEDCQDGDCDEELYEGEPFTPPRRGGWERWEEKREVWVMGSLWG